MGGDYSSSSGDGLQPSLGSVEGESEATGPNAVADVPYQTGTTAEITFDTLVQRAHLRTTPSLRRLGALAYAAQQSRRALGVSAAPGVTRTAALWAAMKLSQELAAALSPYGITEEGLRSAMRMSEVPTPTSVDDAPLETGMREAMETYLSGMEPDQLIDPAHVTKAILLNAMSLPSRSLLTPRLAEMGVTDLTGALERVDALVSPRPMDQPDWSSDAPSEVDLLGRQAFALALAERLDMLGSPTKTNDPGPYLIHLDGAWGAGKSTVLGLLENELQPRDFLVVKVNAWREQRIGVQWWTLYQALRLALVEGAGGGWSRWGARFLTFKDVAVVRGFRAVSLISAILLAVGVGVVAAGSPEIVGAYAGLITQIGALVALIAGGLATARAFLVPDSRRAAKHLEDSSANPMEEVRRLFAKALGRARPKRVVFLIDDLDRCGEEYVVHFLEVVQTLILDAKDVGGKSSRTAGKRGTGTSENAKTASRIQASVVRGPYCVIAADGRWLRSSFENHYEGTRVTEVPGRPLGYRFLEKVFQLHVRLPTISDEVKQTYFTSLLRRSRSDERDRAQQTAVGSATVSDSELREKMIAADLATNPATATRLRGEVAVQLSRRPDRQELKELLPFGRFLEPNPRSMKLFANSVVMQRAVRALEGVLLPTQTLALWCVVETRWPFLADHLREHPEDVDKDPSDVAKPIRALLASEEVTKVIHTSPAGRLDRDKIQLCTGS